MSPLAGQLSYLFASMVMTGFHVYQTFSVRTASTYYDDGKILSTNYWSLAMLIFSYGGLGLFGIAFLTQLMALFGLFVPLNLFWWTSGLGLLGFTYELTLAVFFFLAYDGARALLTSSNATTAATAVKLVAKVFEDILTVTALELWFGFMYITWKDGWMAAQWANLSEESKHEYREEAYLAALEASG